MSLFSRIEHTIEKVVKTVIHDGEEILHIVIHDVEKTALREFHQVLKDVSPALNLIVTDAKIIGHIASHLGSFDEVRKGVENLFKTDLHDLKNLGEAALRAYIKAQVLDALPSGGVLDGLKAVIASAGNVTDLQHGLETYLSNTLADALKTQLTAIIPNAERDLTQAAHMLSDTKLLSAVQVGHVLDDVANAAKGAGGLVDARSTLLSEVTKLAPALGHDLKVTIPSLFTVADNTIVMIAKNDVLDVKDFTFLHNTGLDFNQSHASASISTGELKMTMPLLKNFGADDNIRIDDLIPHGLSVKYTPATGHLDIVGPSGSVGSLTFDNATLGKGNWHIGSDGNNHALLTHN